MASLGLRILVQIVGVPGMRRQQVDNLPARESDVE